MNTIVKQGVDGTYNCVHGILDVLSSVLNKRTCLREQVGEIPSQ